MFGKKSGSEGAIRRPSPISLFTLIGEDRLTFFMEIDQHYILMKQI